MSKHKVLHQNENGVILTGYQKKLKTMKKKFFVLYKETSPYNLARLEYYDNEKKYKCGGLPKRSIKLNECFNINRRFDTKHEFVVALSTKDGGFGIVLESEDDMFKWLDVLLSLQQCNSDTCHPHYDHVWQVIVQKKGLAEEKGILGNFHICLTHKSVTFIRIGHEKTSSGDLRIPNIEFPLTTIRRCGDTQCYFYMEVGRQSVIGPGELWMESEDALTAQNMHKMILNAMSTKTDAYIEPMRKRSSSATECSKPINVLHRKQTSTDIQLTNSPQSIPNFGRERCDSLPSRKRTSSECSIQYFPTPSVRPTAMSGLRTYTYQRHSSSPPMSSTTMGCSESEESSVSVDEPDDNGSFMPYRFNSRSSEGVIPEENTDELLNCETKSTSKQNIDDLQNVSKKPINTIQENYMTMAPVKTSMDFNDKNRLNQTKYCNSLDDTKYVPFVYSINRGRANFEFFEYTSEEPFKTIQNNDTTEIEQHPTRTYSIGSKCELNKNKKQIPSNECDNNDIRVRAFSVGSHAKIPRCDLQRGVLFQKSSFVKQNNNFNSNNNISFTTTDGGGGVVGSSSVTGTTLQQLLNINVGREKKSTSAPLLNQKSSNSVDRMSDLMEIDFSKSQTPSNNRAVTDWPLRNQITKSTFLPNRETSFKKQSTALTSPEDNSSLSNIKNTSRASNKPIEPSKNDNSYLEMRPVGNVNTAAFFNVNNLNKSIGLSSPSHIKRILTDSNSSDNLLINNQPVKLGNDSTESLIEHKKLLTKTVHIPAILKNENNSFDSDVFKKAQIQLRSRGKLDIEKTVIDKMEPKEYILNEKDNQLNNITNLKSSILSSKFAQISVSSTTPTEKINKKNDDYINIDEKFTEIFSTNINNVVNNEIDVKNYEKQDRIEQDSNKLAQQYVCDKKNILNNSKDKKIIQSIVKDNIESGYEILQIKSDSSLQSHKTVNRPFSTINTENLYKQQHPQTIAHMRPTSANSSLIVSTTSISTAPSLTNSGVCISSSTSCLNYVPTSSSSSTSTSSSQIQSNNNNNNNINKTKQQQPQQYLNVTSRPPSVSSEHELYYASLDLPQNNADINIKMHKIESSSDCSTTAVTNVNNTYAKIDFDLSDSSSSSSKNFNI